MTKRHSLTSALLVLSALTVFPTANASDKFQDRAQAAADTLIDMTGTPNQLGMPDKQVPETLISRATCVAVIPNERTVAFLGGATYGRGLASCRVGSGWSTPSYIWLAGGSYGPQVGYKISDVVLFFYGQEHAIEQAGKMQVQLGGEASIGIGPWGRDGEVFTDQELRTEVVSYSRARGAFVGASLEGLFYRTDRKANEHVYGKGTEAHALLTAASDPATASTQEIKNFEAALAALPARHIPAGLAGNNCAPGQSSTGGVCGK